MNCEVVGCSTDSHFVHMRWCELDMKMGGLGPLKYPLLADINKEIARAYNCLIEEGEDRGVALRGTFIIDPK